MSLPALPDNFKPKNFWERPEGTTGMITLGLLAVGGFFLAQAILPTLLGVLTMGIAAVGKAITLTVLCAILAALVYVLTNRKFLTLCGFMFKSVMRKLTAAFVEIDPIGIMKSYIDSLKEKRETMQARIATLRGSITVCENKIKENRRQEEKAMQTAKVALQQQNQNLFTLHSRNAGRVKDFTVRLDDILKKMQLLYSALGKYYDATDIVIQDLQNEVSIRSQERDMILASYSAMSAAKKILQGSGDDRELFDQAMEFVVQDFGMKMGEIDDFMQTSESFISGIDLQNGVFEADALKQIQAWEAKASNVISQDSKRLMVENHSTPGLQFNMSSTEAVPVGASDYSKLFNKS